MKDKEYYEKKIQQVLEELEPIAKPLRIKIDYLFYMQHLTDIVNLNLCPVSMHLDKNKRKV